MKILIATDGSSNSKKALDEAAKIAEGCSVHEVAVIHVHEKNINYPGSAGYHFSQEDLIRFRELDEQSREDSKKLLQSAVEALQQKNIKANPIFETGHPADTIARVAREQDFDLLVVGSRGLGGFQKLLLGSVSNALLQEVNTNILVVK